MYEIRVRGSFSSAHHLRGYRGSCEDVHGHNWVVEVTICGEHLDKTGMLIDFRLAKKMLNSVIKLLDHKDLNKIKPFNKINPTSENIAKYIFHAMSQKNKNSRINISCVRIWETKGNNAAYYLNKKDEYAFISK